MATSIRLSPETEQRLALLASQTGRTKAFYLREMIERGLEDMEDYYLAADVLERVRKGKERVHAAADVRKSLAWTVEYTDTARTQLRKLDRQTARRIFDYMDKRVAPSDDPRNTGRALTRPKAVGTECRLSGPGPQSGRRYRDRRGYRLIG